MSCPKRSNGNALLALLFYLGGFCAQQALAAPPEPSDEEIFQKVFGTKKKDELKAPIVMPVLYESNPQPQGQIPVMVGSYPEDISVDGDELKKVLDRLLDPSAQFDPLEISGSELKEVKQGGRWVPLSYFSGKPYQLTYNEKKLELHLAIPPQIRRKGSVSFGGSGDFGLEQPDTDPAWFSSFFNISSSQDYEFGADPSTSGRQPMRGMIENGTRIADLVFEGSVSVYENKYKLENWNTFARQDFRLIKDFPKQQIRAYAGDLPLALQGFQSAIPMGGIGMVNKPGLNPSRRTTQVGRYQMFLERPSKVTAILNGIPIRTIDLPAGRHDLTDFSFMAGPNDLKFEIIDDLGRKEELSYSFFSSSELLGLGVHDMGYFIGAPYLQNGFSRNYDKTKITGSFFHRYGYSDVLTLGANIQVRSGDLLVGGAAALTAPFGSLGFEPVINTGVGKRTGVALRSRFSTIDYEGHKKSQRSYAFGLISASPGFSQFGTLSDFQPVAHSLTGSYGQALGDFGTLSLGINYALMRPSVNTPYDAFGVSVGVSRNWRKGPSASLSLREDRNSAGQMETSAAIFLNWNFSEEHQSISGSYNAKDDGTALGWTYSSPEPGVGKHDVRLGLKKARDDREFTASGNYTGNRGVVGLNHSAKWLPPQELPVSDSTGQRQLVRQVAGPQNHFSIQAQTALVYAGGRLGIGRPVLDTFALASAEKNLKDETLYLNRKPDSTAYFAKSSYLGGAVMSEISSYSPFVLQVTPDNAKSAVKAGFDKDTFRFLPPYKSGYLVKMGTDLYMSIGANLLYDDDSSPVVTKPGKITSASDAEFKDVQFFTTRSGRTRIEGFKPGQYEIHLSDGSADKYTFTIPEDGPEYIDLGKIRLKRIKQ